MFWGLLIASSFAFSENPNLQEVFISASRVEEPVTDILGNRASVDTNALKMTAHAHIQQALIRIPGVDLHRNDGQEYLPAIRSPVLTGPGACGSFLMAEDGIALRPAGFCNVNELFEAHTEQAQSIEVIRGPANALYGSNALHGVINVIAPAAFNQASTLGLESGPGEYGRVQFAWGDDNQAVAFTGSHDNGFRDDSGVDQQKLSVKGRIDFETFTVTTGMTAINLNQETAGYIQGFEAYKQHDLIKTNPNPEAYRDANAVRLWSRIESSSAQPQWLVTPYARYSSMDFLQHFLPGTPLEENGQTSIGLQSAWYLYGTNSRVITGLDAEVTDGWLKQGQDGPDITFFSNIVPAGQHYDYDVKATQLAPFIQWEWEPASEIKLTASLRYEQMRYDYNNRLADGNTRGDGSACGAVVCRYTRPADRKDTFNNWSPRVGILYRFTDNHQLFATVSRGFRAPQATELYRLERSQQVADLDSERLDSLEVGVRGSTAQLSYEVVAYAMQKDNLIFRDSDFFNVSNGESTHRGLEVATRYQFNENWDISLSATTARHRYDYSQILSDIDIDGNEVDTAPHHFGVINLGWNITDTARAEVEWVRMGGYYTDPENLHRYTGHDLAHLRTRWQLSPSLTLSARIQNLFDTEYAERADYSSFGGDRYFPGQPRSFYAGIQFSW